MKQQLKPKVRFVETSIGVISVRSIFSDDDFDNYHFNLALRTSICIKTTMESRKLNKDEKDFINELEEKNNLIRSKYFTRKESLGITE